MRSIVTTGKWGKSKGKCESGNLQERWSGFWVFIKLKKKKKDEKKKKKNWRWEHLMENKLEGKGEKEEVFQKHQEKSLVPSEGSKYQEQKDASMLF